MPTRPTPRTLPSYSQVDSFDDDQAPWSRQRLPEELDLTNPVARYCNNRWYHYGRKFTPRGPNGWRSAQSGQNSFLCYECRTVFPDLYAARGHSRADDEQALRQAGRAARRQAVSASSAALSAFVPDLALESSTEVALEVLSWILIRFKRPFNMVACWFSLSPGMRGVEARVQFDGMER